MPPCRKARAEGVLVTVKPSPTTPLLEEKKNNGRRSLELSGVNWLTGFSFPKFANYGPGTA